MSKTRIDKWLWAVRVFKTRTLATKACDAGRVKIEGDSIKASRSVRLNEEIHIRKGQERIIYKVVGIIEKRVSATLAQENYEDLSPPKLEIPGKNKLNSAFANFPVAFREKGAGRPTKRDRRDMNKWKDDL